MATARKIFIETSIFVAFIDRGSRNHIRGAKAIEDLASIGYQLYTSSQVITDSYNLLSQTVGNSIALEFLQIILQSSTEILFPQKADLITAYRILNVNKSGQILLSEALNAAMMQRKGIVQVLTFSHWNNLFGSSVSSLAQI